MTVQYRVSRRYAGAPSVAPPPPPPSDGQIWTERIATDAVLVHAGHTISGNKKIAPGVRDAGGSYVMQGQFEQCFILEEQPGMPLREVWQSGHRHNWDDMNNPPKEVFLGSYRLPDYQFRTTTGNDLLDLYDASGNYILGHGTSHRPVATGPLYGNFRRPTPGQSWFDECGTLEEPGQAGSAGATNISTVGTAMGHVQFWQAVNGNLAHFGHALNFLSWGQEFLYYDSATDGKRWPAYKRDNNANNTSSGQGQYLGTIEAYRAGALLTLPYRLTSSQIPEVATDGLIAAMCETLFLYGAYWSDNTAWAAYVWCVQVPIGPNTEADGAAIRRQMQISAQGSNRKRFEVLREVATYMHVVDNNGPDTIAGGGPAAARRF